MPLLRLPIPRLPIKHIHRAFPELDGYSDEQCIRFIKAARRGFYWRAFTSTCITLTSILVTVLAVIAFYAFAERVLDYGPTDRTPSPLWKPILFAVLLIATCALGPVAGYFLRDLFIIRRVRHILRTRGVCPSCRYTLVGLSVGDDLIVTCPECGMTTDVDPALGELAADPDGRARFRPDPSRHRQSRVFTEARVVRLKRVAPWIAGIIIGLPLILAASYEGFIRWQAGVAKSGRVGQNAMDDLVASRQPPGTHRSDPNALEIFQSAIAIQAELDLAHWYGPGTPLNPDAEDSRDIVHPEYSYIRHPPEPPAQLAEHGADEHDSDEGAATYLRRHQQNLRAREIALAMMEPLEASEYFALLHQAVYAPRDDRTFTWRPDTPLELSWISPLQQMRAAASILSARALLALESSDRERYMDSLRDGLALSRLLMRQPIIIEFFSGIACESLMLSSIRDDLMTSLPDTWLEEIDAMLQEHQQHVTYGNWIAGSRLEAIDAFAFIFSDPANVRFGRWSFALANYAAPGLKLGTYRQNIRETERLFDQAVEVRSRPLREVAAVSPATNRLMLIGDFFPMSKNILTIEHRSSLITRGVRTMVALERFRSQHGDYPNALAALIPSLLEEIPIDPWAAGPLGYVRVDPAHDALGRSYLLYSVGSDFQDNGGREVRKGVVAFQVLSFSQQAELFGFDFVINAPN